MSLNPATDSPPLTAGLSIDTERRSGAELATKAQLEGLAKTYDLGPWTFTNKVVIDKRSIPHSHPVLTLHTRHLRQDDELLSTYVHEQLHWYLSAHKEETEAAEHDLMKIYPDFPVGFLEGAQDPDSTYLHLLVCSVEQHANDELMGQEWTKQVMELWSHDHYRWVYRTVLQDGSRLEAVLRSHHLDHPERSAATTK